MRRVYGISNCDTVKKARKWLEDKGIGFAFYDFRKDGLDQATVARWLSSDAADKLLNRRGTTWRKLDAAAQARAEHDLAGLLTEHPTLIKRPVIEDGERVLVGFGAAERAALED